MISFTGSYIVCKKITIIHLTIKQNYHRLIPSYKYTVKLCYLCKCQFTLDAIGMVN